MSVSPCYSPVLDNEVLNNFEQEQSRIPELISGGLISGNPLFYAEGNCNSYFERLTNQQRLNEGLILNNQAQSSKKTKKRKFGASSSYVIRNEPGKARHLINITVHDLSGDSVPEINRSDNNSAHVSVQYLVKDYCDDIMDETQHLISKIVKKISLSN